MNKIFAPFLPPWVETGLQPAFYDMESGTVLQQTARMYAKVQQLTRLFNEFSEDVSNEVNNFENDTNTEIKRFEGVINATVEEYIDKFVALKDFVDDYFDNLDVQEEIDHKLDEMAESGELAEILGVYLKLNIHAVKASSATYIVEFPNGKNLIVDSGKASEWTDIKNAIDSLKITKFDYFIITHFHDDHIGNLQNLLSTYDFTDAKCYIQMKPDWLHHSANIQESESDYTTPVTLLINNGLAPIVPENDSYEIVDEENDIKLHFLNTDETIAESYYGTYGEWTNTYKVNFNAFSLITELIFKKTNVLFTGDIEAPTESAYADYMTKTNVMTAPHHGSNRDGSREFYLATMADYIICSNPTFTQSSYRSFMKPLTYMMKNASQLITSFNSTATNGLFSFYSDGEVVKSNCNGGGLTEKAFNFNNCYQEIDGLVNWATQKPSTITLEQLIANLPEGYEMNEYMTNTIQTRYPVVTSDLQTIFGLGTNSFLAYLRIKKHRLFTEMEMHNKYISVSAIRDTLPNSTPTAWQKKGYGVINVVINGKENLIALLKTLPLGHYIVKSYSERDNELLVPTYGYELAIDVGANNDSDGTRAFVQAIVKYDTENYPDTSPNWMNKTVIADAYYSSQTTPDTLVWRSILINKV